MTSGQRRIAGWAAVGFSTAVSCFWAFWGSIEGFHEGWYHHSALMNLAMMIAQHLAPMLVFMCAGLIALVRPRLGGGLHLVIAAAAAWFLRGASSAVVLPLVVGPLLALAGGYWCGRAAPRGWAAGLLLGLPLATMMASGVEPALRVARRIEDGDRGARRVTANGVDLAWAPEGPGWPREGVSWEEAVRRCRHLTEDGRALAETPQEIWRLPTIEEAVRSQARHGQNCGGSWDAARARASYRTTPDKESPLWDIHSMVVYWWTETEASDEKAFVIAYNGQVRARSKRARWGYLGFRAVKSPER